MVLLTVGAGNSILDYRPESGSPAPSRPCFWPVLAISESCADPPFLAQVHDFEQDTTSWQGKVTRWDSPGPGETTADPLGRSVTPGSAGATSGQSVRILRITIMVVDDFKSSGRSGHFGTVLGPALVPRRDSPGPTLHCT